MPKERHGSQCDCSWITRCGAGLFGFFFFFPHPGIPAGPPGRPPPPVASAISGQVIPNVLIQRPPRCGHRSNRLAGRGRGGGRFGNIFIVGAVSFCSGRAQAQQTATPTTPGPGATQGPSSFSLQSPHQTLEYEEGGKKKPSSRSSNASPCAWACFRRATGANIWPRQPDETKCRRRICKTFDPEDPTRAGFTPAV